MTARTVTPLIRALACAWLLASSLATAQHVTITRDSTLHAGPKAEAAAVAQLQEGSSAEVIARKGAWVNVKSDAGTGWLYSFNVTYAGAGGKAPASAPAAGNRRGITASIGIRGLEKDDLKNGTFDAEELDALDSFAGESAKAPRKK